MLENNINKQNRVRTLHTFTKERQPQQNTQTKTSSRRKKSNLCLAASRRMRKKWLPKGDGCYVEL